jgi:tRNA splicing ligase
MDEEIEEFILRVDEEKLALYLLINNPEYAKNLAEELKNEVHEQVETLPFVC